MQLFIQNFYPKSTCKLFINCDSVKNPSSFWKETDPDQDASISASAACAIMGYSTNPSFFTFSDRENCSGKITIDHIDFISKKNIFESETLQNKIRNLNRRISIRKYCKKNEIIRIPIKKLIALPCGQSNPNNPLPSSLTILDNSDTKFFGALVLGGAEQNIILSTLINTYKWRKDRGIDKRLDCRYYGFAENLFDTKGLLGTEFHPEIASTDVEYLIGTEGFVYGMPTRAVVGKLTNSDNCRQAEVFKLVIDDLPYYFIYGYHAIATKIATLKFFVNLSNHNQTFLPSRDPERIAYKLHYPPDPSFRGLCDFWDKGDPINSDSTVLLQKLEDIQVL